MLCPNTKLCGHVTCRHMIDNKTANIDVHISAANLRHLMHCRFLSFLQFAKIMLLYENNL